MPPRSPFPIFASSSDARAALVQGLIIASIVITGLYIGREVLLPLALAILLSFVLTPSLLLLRRLKVPRILAVAIVVSFAFTVIAGLGWMLSQQATQLANELPSYQYTLTQKISSLRQSLSASPAFEKAAESLKDLERQLGEPNKPKTGTLTAPNSSDAEPVKPVPVEIREPAPKPLQIWQEIAGTVLPPLATAGIVLLFVIFILVQREDLRDRVIRLLGSSDLQRATGAVNDAAGRLSQYFTSQVLLNSAYGAFIALGLWMIGVPSPIVWGILAMLMRFVPYVGSFIAAAPPLVLAAVVDPGWTPFLLTGALYLVSELTMGQVIEPLVFGHGTGLSPLAVVISTVFWTWLWGPLGLLLAMPLTVCLVVLGRHVEGLSFFEVLLGNAPPLTPEESFYQRALTGDSAEATYQAELCLKEGKPLVSYLDDIAMKGLQLAERDAERGSIDKQHLERVEQTVDEMMDNLSEFEPRRWFRKVEPHEKESGKDGEHQTGLAGLEEAGEAETFRVVEPTELAPGFEQEDAVLCIGGRTPLDEAAATMLAGVLKKQGLHARAVKSEAISAAHIVSLEASKAKLVCLSYLGIGGSAAHVRYLVRRLRRILPEGSTVLVGYWTEDAGSDRVKAIEDTVEADAYAISLREATEICLKKARGESDPVNDKVAARVA